MKTFDSVSPEGHLSLPRNSGVFDRRVVAVLGLPFDVLDMTQAVLRVRRAAFNGEKCFISTPNLSFLMAALKDPGFRDSVLRSDLSLVDGMPVVWVCRWLGLPIRERISGSNLFDELTRQPSPVLRVHFLGGPAGIAQRAHERLNESHSEGAVSVGYVDPGRCSLESLSATQVIETINHTQPHFLVVAVGAQKGQSWIERNRARLSAPVVGYFGAVVNFVAGSVRRAPVAWQRLGLEWVWRIKQEPGLCRRYWRDGWRFLFFLSTCVLPLALSKNQKGLGEAQAEPAVRWFASQELIRVSLSGAWVGPDLAALRQTFKDVQTSDLDLPIEVDLSQVSYVDSHCIGLLMLAKGVFGRRFQLRGAGVRLRRLLRWHLADYLLQTPARGVA